jgi:hypothetical protein
MDTSYNLKQLQEIYGIDVRTCREYLKRKELRAFKIGRTYRVFEHDLIDFIREKEAYTWSKRGAYPFDA